jgi:hypothetical protein
MLNVKIIGWFAGSWLSRIYLALVTVATVWSSVSLLTWDGQSPNYADIGPTALTLPGSLISGLFQLLPVPGDSDLFWLIWLSAVAVGALLNAAALNGLVALARRLRAKRRPATAQ